MFVYKVYSEERPSSIKESDSPFYLGINYTKNPTEKQLFKAKPYRKTMIQGFPSNQSRLRHKFLVKLLKHDF